MLQSRDGLEGTLLAWSRSLRGYDLRILEAVRALDDRAESMAEISRRVGVAAAQAAVEAAVVAEARRAQLSGGR